MTEITASEDFKKMIHEWVTLDDQLKEVGSDMKEVRKRHKELKQDILHYMMEKEIGTCNIMGGEEQLCMNYRDKKLKPKKTDIVKKMAAFLTDDKKAADLYDYVFEQCETESVTSLTRKASARARKRKREEKENEEENGENA